VHLVVEVVHVDDQILDYLLVRERFDADGFVKVRDLRFTTESLSAVDEEGVGATDRLSTGVSERERRIVLVAGVDQRIQTVNPFSNGT